MVIHITATAQQSADGQLFELHQNKNYLNKKIKWSLFNATLLAVPLLLIPEQILFNFKYSFISISIILLSTVFISMYDNKMMRGFKKKFINSFNSTIIDATCEITENELIFTYGKNEEKFSWVDLIDLQKHENFIALLFVESGPVLFHNDIYKDQSKKNEFIHQIENKWNTQKY